MDSELFCVAWATLMSYLRMATHPRIFAHPLSPSEALGNVEALIGMPRMRVLPEGDKFLDVYRAATGGWFLFEATSFHMRTWLHCFASIRS